MGRERLRSRIWANSWEAVARPVGIEEVIQGLEFRHIDEGSMGTDVEPTAA